MDKEITINNLHEELARIGGVFAIFAGTGVVGETGVPDSWKVLLQALAEQVPGYSVDFEHRSTSEYPEIAQEIYDNLVKENKRNTYYDVIRQKIKATNSPYSSQAYDIILTTKGIITTNFDNVFEVAYKRYAESKGGISPEVKTESLPNLNTIGDFSEHTVAYLHGRADENHIVFKTDDYKHYYPSVSGKSDGDRILENYLEWIYSKYTIVFIGVSFNDPYLRECLKGIFHRLEARDKLCSGEKIGYREILPKIKHYAILPNVQNTGPQREIELDIQRQIEETKISVVRFNEKREWQDCLERLRIVLRERQPISVGIENKEAEAK